jgi:hypothetical protein
MSYEDIARLKSTIVILEKRIKSLEKIVKRIGDKHLNTYSGIDSRMSHKEDKKAALKKYNKENKTRYKHISEAMVKMYSIGMDSQEIADIFDVTTPAIFETFRKLNVKFKTRRGGRAGIIIPTEKINYIRKSNKKLWQLAIEVGVSKQTIHNIRAKKGRWADL